MMVGDIGLLNLAGLVILLFLPNPLPKVSPIKS